MYSADIQYRRAYDFSVLPEGQFSIIPYANGRNWGAREVKKVSKLLVKDLAKDLKKYSVELIQSKGSEMIVSVVDSANEGLVNEGKEDSLKKKLKDLAFDKTKAKRDKDDSKVDAIEKKILKVQAQLLKINESVDDEEENDSYSAIWANASEFLSDDEDI